jgi:hypothetical protein
MNSADSLCCTPTTISLVGVRREESAGCRQASSMERHIRFRCFESHAEGGRDRHGVAGLVPSPVREPRADIKPKWDDIRDG